MKTLVVSFIVLFTLASPLSYAAKKKHNTAPVTTAVFGICAGAPTVCPMIVDNTLTCKAVAGKQSLEEGAQDSDNASCMKMRLQKKICARGWQSELFKVTCR